MNYSKIFTFIVVVWAVFFLENLSAQAAVLPIFGVEILAKSLVNGMVAVGRTDENGNFRVNVREENGVYDVFVNDESFPAIKITANGAVVSGRVVILTEGTTTKEPEPVKKTTKTTTTLKTKNLPKPLPKPPKKTP